MDNLATFVDLYQLTMLQSYWREGMDREATFDLFIRRQKNRDYFLVAGVTEALRKLEDLEFSDSELNFLRGQEQFANEFVDWLEEWTFNADVFGVRDGQVMYSGQPILQVSGDIRETQLVETLLLNQIGFQTNIATKASHIVRATNGQTVADFGMRRAQGFDAAMKGARAMYQAGVDATSNVAAGQKYGIPITGTMAHSYVEAHDDERHAFEEFAKTYPGTIVLVDTYDTLKGVESVIDLMVRTDTDIGGIRLDSGDLAHLSKMARRILDDAGFEDVKIFASSSLDENKIRDLQSRDAKIDGYGVGTKMATVADQPYADAVYKLCEYDGKGRMKLSSGKSNLPGKKQVWHGDSKTIVTERDSSPTLDEMPEGEAPTPVMRPVMKNGDVVEHNVATLEEAKERDQKKPYMELKPREANVSKSLQKRAQEVAERVSTA